ncbi:MAG: hypothetical protein ACOCYZ_01475 [Halococcoides sp.]
MVRRDHITRRKAFKRAGAAVAGLSGIALTSAASAAEGSEIEIRGDGSYAFDIMESVNVVDTENIEDVEDNVADREDRAVRITGHIDETPTLWFFGGNDDVDRYILDKEISKNDVQTGIGFTTDDGVEIYVDGERRT